MKKPVLRKIEVELSNAFSDKLMRRVSVVFNTKFSPDEIRLRMQRAIQSCFSE